MSPPVRPLALFGACDRHNLGDLLFPRLVDALLPPGPRYHLGLAARDLRRQGGHRLRAIGDPGLEPAALVHCGGELLACTAPEAAFMLASPDQARLLAARREATPAAPLPGLADRAPYVVGAERFGPQVPRFFNAVGGVGLAERDPAFVAEVIGKLRHAAHLGVRDRVTRDFLARHGIRAALAPDPAVLVAALFGPALGIRARHNPVAALRRAFPGGYLAMQFSADFGDDATLDTLAEQLRRLPADLGVVLFLAGAAPWHDDAAVYRRLAARLGNRPARVCTDLNIWNLCALIGEARAFVGSSLHGRIVASAWGLPALSLAGSAAATAKVAAYVTTWESVGESAGDSAGEGRPVPAATLADGLGAALAVPARRRRELAADLAATYRRYLADWLPLTISRRSP